MSLGLVVGLYIVSRIAPHFASDTTRGRVALAVLVIAGGLTLILGGFVGRWLKMKLLVSRFAAADRYLAVPATAMAFLLVLTLLANIMLYIPVVALQFQAQGSTLQLNLRRYLPVSNVQQMAQIAPDQFDFNRYVFEYDQEPITNAGAQNAGPLQQYIDASTQSAVRIAGRKCGVGQAGGGSGFVAAPGYVVTNAHVVTGMSPIFLRTQTGTYPATLMAIDNDHDLAVLYSAFIPEPPLGITTKTAKPGEDVAVLGYPLGGDLTASPGKITSHTVGLSRSTHVKLDRSNAYAFSANTAKGNSGSPLLGPDGEVIGVVNSLQGERPYDVVTGGSVSGSSGFAIHAKLVVPLLKKAEQAHFSLRSGGCSSFQWYKNNEDPKS